MSLTQDVRDQAQEVALCLARAAHRRCRRRQYAGVVRLVLECLVVVVAVRGLAGCAWPDAVLVALGVMLADLTLLAAAAALPPWVRTARMVRARRRGGVTAVERGRDLLATSVMVLGVCAVVVGGVVLGPVPGLAGTLLLIGAGALLLHLSWLFLAEGWAKLRLIRRRRRDVVAGVLVPIVELLDMVTSDRALGSGEVRAQAVDLLWRVASNLARASHRSSYPTRGGREDLARQCKWHALDIARPFGAPRAEPIFDRLQEVRDFASGLLARQLQAMHDEAGRGCVQAGDAATAAPHPRGVLRTTAEVLIGLGGTQAPEVPGESGVLGSRPGRCQARRPRPWLWAVHLLLVAGVVAEAFRACGWGQPGPRLELVALAGFVALCGVVAALLIESVTAVLSIRAVYHRRRLRVWLADRLGPLSGAEAMRQLDDLLTARTTPGRTRRGLFLASPVTSIYNLPTE